jgi:two-component system sensor histidine kinase KdpD
MPGAEPAFRPDPDLLLARVKAAEAREARGRLKIFFGATAGVGKTYAMLEAARKRQAEGIDVVVGYVEPHGRAETEALLRGLEVMPFLQVDYRGARLTEFDLDAALRRAPALLLVDEFAHSNVPGGRHAKRWQDVQELLEAGIDVYTTVNVQHLESLNDVVAQITGARMQETVPDHVFDRADEVELIDISPEDLLQRLKEGRVYVPERARQAIDNFFRKGNLIALREMALRATADRVDAEMREYRADHAISATWAAAERLLVAVGPDAQAELLVRAGKRMAAALRAQWLVVYVETPELLKLPEQERNRRIGLLRLAESLGAETVTLDGITAAQAVLDYARTRNVTRILVGRPNRHRWAWFARRSTTRLLLEANADIDIYVVGAGRVAPNPVLARSGAYLGVAPPSTKTRWPGYLWGLAATLSCTALSWWMTPAFELANLIMVYMLGAVLIATRYGHGPAIMVSVVNVAAFDFFFVPPRFSFAVSDTQYLVTFAIMLAVAIVISNLTASVRLQARVAGHRERRAALLYAMSRELAATRGLDNIAASAVRHTGEVFDAQVAVLLPDAAGRIAYPKAPGIHRSLRGADLGVAQLVYTKRCKAGLGTDTLPGGDTIYLPLAASSPSADPAGPAPGVRGVLALLPSNPRRILLPEQMHLLDTFASQIALALERASLADQAQDAAVSAEAERLRSSLLASISHDLRTPLAVIAGSASSLIEAGERMGGADREALARAIYGESRRMGDLVNNILDMTRLEGGAVRLNLEWVALEEIAASMVARIEARAGESGAGAATRIRLAIDPDLPLLKLDAMLIEQLLTNLIENALKYAPGGTPIEVGARAAGDAILITVADHGPGIRPGDEERVFDKFYRGQREGAIVGVGLGLTICRAIARCHGGGIAAANRSGSSGAVFTITLPRGPAAPAFAPEAEQ